MSDANAAFSFPKDELRQKLLWVDDFTLSEAHQNLDKLQFLINQESKRNEIFAKIGSRPGMLQKMVDEGKFLKFTIGEKNVDTFVESVIDNARITLSKLLEIKFQENDPKKINFNEIHKALLKKPSGVPAMTFHGATRLPEEAFVYLRKFHAFVYHYPTDQYRYAGKEYENASKGL